MGDMGNSYNILVGEPEGKIPLEGSRCTWEDNFRMDLRKTGWDNLDWMIWIRIGTSGGPL
jgi:hypothetical protein